MAQQEINKFIRIKECFNHEKNNIFLGHVALNELDFIIGC